MALADVISQLGTTIINLVSNTVQGIADYLNGNIGNIPDTGGESVSMMEFVKNTPVDTLETTSKTIVGSINELKESSSSGSSVDIVTTISADSTDEQVPSAKCMWDLIGDVETLLSEV